MTATFIKTSLTAILLVLSIEQQAQTPFWTEDFGTGCDQGNVANNYATTNGTWTVTSTGTNLNYANEWYISATEAGRPTGSCGDGCLNNGNLTDRTLHLGNAEIPSVIDADLGAAYFSSQTFCNSSICGETNKRVESPTIDCTGKDTITISFNYIEGGLSKHNATLQYYDGNNWTEIDVIAKTNNTNCNPQGLWTAFSATLPASANNNANVKIGFNWTNDDDNNATDPSFAVDSIQLSTSAAPPPVASFTVDEDTVCENECVNFTDQSTGGATSWNWTFTGGTPSSSTVQNPTNICYATAGTYDVKLVATNTNGSDSVTQTSYINVEVCVGVNESESISSSIVYPNPANTKEAITISNISTKKATLKVYTTSGKLVNVDYEVKTNQIIIGSNQLAVGVYVLEILSENTVIGKKKLVVQ